VVVFVTRDHNYGSEYFSSIGEGDTIHIKVIGQRFELYDDHISIVAQLVEPSAQGHHHGGYRTDDKIPRLTIN
jgi:hypothetical protein